MVNGTRAVMANPLDLGFERRDARVELRDRERIEILVREHRQRIVAPKRKILVGIHAAKR